MAAVTFVRAGMSTLATTAAMPAAAPLLLDDPFSLLLLAALKTSTAPSSPKTRAIMMSLRLPPLAAEAIDRFILTSPPGRTAALRTHHAYARTLLVVGSASRAY